MAQILLAGDDRSARYLVHSLHRVGHAVRSVCDRLKVLSHTADVNFELLASYIVMLCMGDLKLLRRTG